MITFKDSQIISVEDYHDHDPISGIVYTNNEKPIYYEEDDYI